MRAVISPYEPSIDDPEMLVPCVVNDLEPKSWTSSDIPDSIPFENERLIILDDDKHAEAVSLGYMEVEAWL